MRLLGLDYGDKTVGVAVSDALGITAQSTETIRREHSDVFKPVMKRLKDIIGAYGITAIVLGYPKNMNNTPGERCRKTEDFKRRLESAFGLPVVLWDERLSTAGASRALLEADMSRKKRRDVVDKQAAAFILQGYMDYISKQNKDKEQVSGMNDNGANGDYVLDDFDDEESFDKIIIPDENGVDVEYYIFDSIEHKGGVFLLVVEVDMAEDDEADALLLKQVGEDEENYTYEEPTDEEFAEIAQILNSRSDEYEIEL
jgi:putative Holliday junction resolvase